LSDGSFTLKTIRVTVTLGEGSFGGKGNAKIIEGLGAEVSVSKPGPPEKPSANIKLTGLKLDDMAQMTMLSFLPMSSLKNHVAVQAGNQGDANLPVVFWGEITAASADFNQAPDIVFNIDAETGSYPALIASPQETARGQASAAALIEKYAKQIGYGFKNEGVSASVKNAVLNGSPMEKIKAVAGQVGCEIIIDDGEIVIMPAGGARSGNAVLMTRETGMIGYPTFTSDGISLKCVYNPEIKIGGLLRVESVVPRASGVWKITKLDHNLSAYKASGGPWSSSLSAVFAG
jgi:hypothetical protein